MSNRSSGNNAANQIEEQPKALLVPMPFLLTGLLALMLFLGMLYVDYYGGNLQFKDTVYSPYGNFAQVDDEQFHDPLQERIIHGKNLFMANCSPCHQSSGLGVAGQFPPIAGSEWVNAKSPARIIRGVLCGLQGPIMVKNQLYNNVMVPWKDTLKDQDIADVLLFIRKNKEWGNDASDVTAEEVATIRAEVKDHAAFISSELEKVPMPP